MKINKEQREAIKTKFGELQLSSLSVCELVECDSECKTCPIRKMQKKIIAVKQILLELPKAEEEQNV